MSSCNGILQLLSCGELSAQEAENIKPGKKTPSQLIDAAVNCGPDQYFMQWSRAHFSNDFSIVIQSRWNFILVSSKLQYNDR